MVAKDITEVFLDGLEFADSHHVEGRYIMAVLDADTGGERPGGQALGVAGATLTLYAAVEDLPERKPAGESLEIDGEEYIIVSWREDMGIASVSLAQTITM